MAGTEAHSFGARRLWRWLTRPERPAVVQRAASLLTPYVRRLANRGLPSPGRRIPGSFHGTETVREIREEWLRHSPEQADTAYFRTHIGRFAYLVEVIRGLGMSGACLDVGGTSRTRGLLERFTGLGLIECTRDVDLEIDRWSEAAGVGRYDLVVFSEVIEHFNADPAHALHEINRTLRPGGWLVLTTVNVASVLGLRRLSVGEAPYAMANIHGHRGDRHQREYAPLELQRLVAAHGFETFVGTVDVYPDAVAKREARDWMRRQRGYDLALHGDTIVVLGRKVAESSRPRWLHPIYHQSVSENEPDRVPPDVASRLMGGWPPGLDHLAWTTRNFRP